jgi:hypothetical protein
VRATDRRSSAERQACSAPRRGVAFGVLPPGKLAIVARGWCCGSGNDRSHQTNETFLRVLLLATTPLWAVHDPYGWLFARAGSGILSMGPPW